MPEGRPRARERMTASTAIPTARRRTPRSGGRRPIVWLFGVGATAATLSLVLGPASIDRTQVAGICGATWGLAAILCFVPRRLPRWAVHLLLAAGTLLVEWITLASGDMTSPYP